MRRPLLAVLAAVLLLTGVAAVPAAQADGPAPKRVASGWLPYWMTSPGRPDGVNSAVQNADLFTDVSPFWYSATAKSGGGVQVRLNPNFTQRRRQRGLGDGPAQGRRTDGAAGHRGRLGQGPHGEHAGGPGPACPARRRHRRTSSSSNGYDGIDLDYETFAFSDGSSSWGATQPNWTAFVTELGAALQGAGQAARRHHPAAVQHRGRVRPEVRLLGLQHRRHRACRRPHPDHGLRLPRQRHRADRADAVGAVDRPVHASPSWTRRSSRSACPPTGARGRASTATSPGSTGTCPTDKGSAAYRSLTAMASVTDRDIPALLASVGVTDQDIQWSEADQENWVYYDKKVNWTDAAGRDADVHGQAGHVVGRPAGGAGPHAAGRRVRPLRGRLLDGRRRRSRAVAADPQLRAVARARAART